MESQQEQIQSIAKKNGVTIDDIFFHPYYMSYGRPVYSNKKYSIQEMLSLQGGSEDLRNKILEVYYSNKNLTKNKYGCKNFACNESRTCIVFPFSNTNKEILANGFAIYLRVRND